MRSPFFPIENPNDACSVDEFSSEAEFFTIGNQDCCPGPGYIVGPQGPQGATGPQGPVGPSGSDITVYGTFGDPVLISSSIVVGNQRNQLFYIKGMGGPVDLSSINPQITSGYQDGDAISIICVDSTDTVKISDGNGTKTNGDITMVEFSTIDYRWSEGASLWVERSRNDI